MDEDPKVCPCCGQKIKTTPEDVIEIYYRSRAAVKTQSGKVTLKELAKRYGFNYKYLSSVKSAYDRAGKWGSTKKRMPTSTKGERQ